MHLAVGRSYPETGGVNESAVHWDMICDLRSGGRLQRRRKSPWSTDAFWTDSRTTALKLGSVADPTWMSKRACFWPR